MSLWDTLYRWLCHHETLYIGGYVIMKHPMQIGISLRNAPCRCLCHCGIPCIGGYVIMEHPMQIGISLRNTLQCFLDTTYLNTAFFLLLSAFLPTPVFFLLYLCKLILNRTYILQRIPCYNVHFRGHQSAFFLYFQPRYNVHQKNG